MFSLYSWELNTKNIPILLRFLFFLCPSKKKNLVATALFVDMYFNYQTTVAVLL